jgi:DNA mismatch repair protein MutH
LRASLTVRSGAARKTRALAPRVQASDAHRHAQRAADRPAPPRDERELLARARGLAGHSIAELAARAGIALPLEPRRAKGFAGALVERLLGADAGNASAPDFVGLGIELKTIPLDVRGKPRESTFVCCVAMAEIAETEWESSAVARKLARVLWVPIESPRRRSTGVIETDCALEYGARRIGSPRLWSPSAADQAALRADWEELAALIARGEGDRLSACTGRWLQLRPKAANSRVLGRAVDEHGVPTWTSPRGFYLRASFTAQIFN